MLPLIALIATPIVGLLLAVRIHSRPAGRVRMQLTRFGLDEQGQNYWDGAAWQPIVSRYAAPSPPRGAALPLKQVRAASTIRT